jgi:hypothetical protein
VKIVRAAIAFHSVTTAGSDPTGGTAWLGAAITAGVARQMAATPAKAVLAIEMDR